MIEQKLHNNIKKVINSITILSEDSYSINGIHRDLSKIRIKNEHGVELINKQDSKATKFKEILKTDIYNNLYKISDESIPLSKQVINSEDFLLNLSKNNCGKGTWEDGWNIIDEDISNNKIIVSKGTVKYWVKKEEVKTSNGTFIKKAPCLVKIPKEIRKINPFFYMAFGNMYKEQIANFENQLTRFYWNLTPVAASPYIKLITETLNTNQVYFKTKVVSSPENYLRSDAGVLYIDKSQFTFALPLILDVHKKLKSTLKTKTPMFTKSIGKGLSFAEDPKGVISFGISRATIISELLYNCFIRKINIKEDIFKEAQKTFLQKGINPEFPYSSNKNLKEYENLFTENSLILN